jgi:hypothetical protein
MYLNGGDYFCGIYTTWTQHIDRVGWCSENNLEIVFRRYRTMRMSFRDFASVFENESRETNTGHDVYLLLFNFPSHSTPM